MRLLAMCWLLLAALTLAGCAEEEAVRREPQPEGELQSVGERLDAAQPTDRESSR